MKGKDIWMTILVIGSFGFALLCIGSNIGFIITDNSEMLSSANTQLIIAIVLRILYVVEGGLD